MIGKLWLQEIANDICLPTLPVGSCQTILSHIESDLKKVIQLSFKLQRSAKKSAMSVEDIVLALSVISHERIYGLLGPDRSVDKACENNSSSNVGSDMITVSPTYELVDYASRQLPQYPLVPEVCLHWLAIDGVQPHIPQNPHVVVYDSSADTSGLPREIAFFYSKLTKLVLSASPSESSGRCIREACGLLRHDRGLQSLVSYLCRFIFVQTQRNLRSVHILHAIIQVIQSLVLNSDLCLESCLHQLLPPLVSCIVGAKVGDNPADKDHLSTNYDFYIQFPLNGCESLWKGLKTFHIRSFAATVVRVIIERYGDAFPDLLPRVCKTYMRAALMAQAERNDDRSCVAVRFGGIIGLSMLGEHVVREVLFPNVSEILRCCEIDVCHTTPSTSYFGHKSKAGKPCSHHIRQASFDFEYLLLCIFQWYVRKCTSKSPSLLLTKEIQCRRANDLGMGRCKRRRLTSPYNIVSLTAVDLDKFIDKYVEILVPHYAASNSVLQNCTGLFI